MPEFTGQSDLRSYARILWRWKFLFLALLVAAPVVTFLLERGKPKIYQSRAVVAVSQLTVGSSVSGGVNFSTTNPEAISQLITGSEVADIAGHQMSPPVAGATIVHEISASSNATTGFITITATDESPAHATAVANAFAKALVVLQKQSLNGVNANIKQVETKLAHTKADSPTYSGLQNQLTALEAERQTQTTGASVITPAAADYTPIGPHTRRAVELGIVIGLLLGFAAVMLVETADRRLRTPDDLEAATSLPLLAAIPPSAFSDALDTGPVDEEAFQMLRTSLMYFTSDRPLSSVLITSPGEKEGKSTIAARLALVSAAAGLNVVLVDADMRRAGATAKFGIHQQSGLTDVLSGQATLESVMVDWPAVGDGTLRIVPAGPPASNASALVSSAQMQHVLRDLDADADLVIVDSPAALAVSDAVPLMRQVSGIVLVARINRSSQETIARLRKMIEASHGNLLGVVANGVTAGGYGKYSRDYYGPVDHGRSRAQSNAQNGSHNGVPLTPPGPTAQDIGAASDTSVQQ